MEEPPAPPHSEDLVSEVTSAPPKRPRADSGSSTTVESNRSVRTLASDDLEYVHENGRTYGNETYYLPCVYLPNDDFIEQDRLSLQHQIFVQALQGKLTTTKPLPTIKRILDLGTGPGHWAVAIARQYPNAEVVGIDMVQWDIDTTEATLGESRVTWELDDLDVWGKEPEDMEELIEHLSKFDFFTETNHRNPIESPTRSKSGSDGPVHSQPNTSVEELAIDLSKLTSQPQPGWHFSDSFDLIHLRNMKGSFAHWEEVYSEIYKSLAPGGWIEIADYDLGQVPLPPSSSSQQHDGTSTSQPPYPMPTLRKLYASIMQASFNSGRPLGLYYMHPSYLSEAGFTDIQTTHVNVPIGQWSTSESQRSLGKMMLVLIMETFEANLLRLLTKYGDKERVWSEEEVRRDIVRAQGEVAEWCDRAEKGEVEGWCASFKWITGRKRWQS